MLTYALSVLCFVAAAQAPLAEDLNRAMQLASRGDFAQAEQILRSIEKADPKNFEVRYRLGLILLRRGNSAEAAERLEAASLLAPSSPLAWLALAQARLKLDRRETALEAASRAAKLAPDQPPVWRALAIFYADARDYARAAEFEQRWGRASPGDLESQPRLCRYGLLAGNAPLALNACSQALERHKTAELHRFVGQAYRLAKDPAKAVEAFQNAIHLEPEQPSAYLDLATLFLDHRTPQPAVAVLESAVARIPKDPELHRLLGLAHYQIGAIDKAINAFCAITDLDPNSDVGYASLETLLPDAGARLPEIVLRLKKFRARRPQSPVGHFLLARALAIEQAARPQLEALLREAIRAEPGFWPAHYELGQLLDAQGKSPQAIQALAQAVRLNPEYAPAHYSLARLYLQSGDRTRAVKHRKLHHELLNRQKEAAERRRIDTPALPYRIEPATNGR